MSPELNTALAAAEAGATLGGVHALGARAQFAGEETFRATIEATHVAPAADLDWAGLLASLTPEQRVLISLPFRPDGEAIAHVVLSEPGPEIPTSPLGATPRQHTSTEMPSEAEYAAMVRAALDDIAADQVRKVVLGRCLEVRCDPPLPVAHLHDRLLRDRPGRYVFALPLSAPRPDAPWLVGASPELLVRRRGSSVASTPLAGSAVRAACPREDRRRGEDLLASAKDLGEHAFVVDHIAAVLAPWCDELDVPRAPSLVRTDTLWHLATPIRGRLRHRGGALPSAAEIATALHPTPAVAGVPTAAALARIDRLEGDLRGPLAGVVGWVDPRGDGELVLALRSAVVSAHGVRLFAGAGIVAGSDPDSEVQETRAKLATVARAVTGAPR